MSVSAIMSLLQFERTFHSKKVRILNSMAILWFVLEFPESIPLSGIKQILLERPEKAIILPAILEPLILLTTRDASRAMNLVYVHMSTYV